MTDPGQVTVLAIAVVWLKPGGVTAPSGCFVCTKGEGGRQGSASAPILHLVASGSPAPGPLKGALQHTYCSVLKKQYLICLLF